MIYKRTAPNIRERMAFTRGRRRRRRHVLHYQRNKLFNSHIKVFTLLFMDYAIAEKCFVALTPFRYTAVKSVPNIHPQTPALF